MNLLKQPDSTFNYNDLADKKLPLAKKRSAGIKPRRQVPEPAALPLVLPNRMSIKKVS